MTRWGRGVAVVQVATARLATESRVAELSEAADERGRALYGEAWDESVGGSVPLKDIFSLGEDDLREIKVRLFFIAGTPGSMMAIGEMREGMLGRGHGTDCEITVVSARFGRWRRTTAWRRMRRKSTAMALSRVHA